MEFHKGMDISFLPEVLEQGAKFYRSTGEECEVFELLHENGVNAIRLRIWNEPGNVPESGGYCDLEHTINMAKKIKHHGMKFFLDFHYSDFWADPGKQEKPKAWRKFEFDELKQAVYNYTKEVLLALDSEKVFPDMIQIGNEIRSGMLFPEGEVPNYNQLVQLVNAGISAVKVVRQNRDTKVVIHLDQGGRFYYLRDWFDKAIEAGLDDFDIIGVSYYPFWHGTFTDFKGTLDNLVNRYHKPIVIAETAYAWRLSDTAGFIGKEQERIAGFPATPTGQKQVIDLVMNITASLKHDMGLGIYYWEPVVLPKKGMGGWSSNMGLFDEKGSSLPALECFQFNKSNCKLDQIAKIYEPITTIVSVHQPVILPTTVRVLYYNGKCINKNVCWDNFNSDLIGEYIVNGQVEDIDTVIHAKIHVVEQLTQNHNYIQNSSFENGFDYWNIKCLDDRVTYEIHTDFDVPSPAQQVNYLYIESPVNFHLELESTINGLKPGMYCLQVEYRGTNTTGVDVRLFAKNCMEDKTETIIYPSDEEWIQYQRKGIYIPEGKLIIGITIDSPPIFGKIRRFTLTRQEE